MTKPFFVEVNGKNIKKFQTFKHALFLAEHKNNPDNVVRIWDGNHDIVWSNEEDDEQD